MWLGPAAGQCSQNPRLKDETKNPKKKKNPTESEREREGTQLNLPIK